MVFLIDFENVHNNGFGGLSYADEKDEIYIFFSASAPNMDEKTLELLDFKKCHVEFIRLIKTGKNGLDFYIATKIGELIGKGHSGPYSIISNDKGYQAILDFWGHYNESEVTIFLAGSIKSALEKDKTDRGLYVRNTNPKKSLNKLFEEQQYIKRKSMEIKGLLSNPLSNEEIKSLVLFLRNAKNNREIYLYIIKNFKKNSGLQIYNDLKPLFNKGE